MTSGPPATFVPADDNLFPPLAHSGMWLALGIVAALLAVAVVLWILHALPDAGATAHAARQTVKGEYLAEIDTLHQRFARREITERQLHHELSATVRRYAAEHGVPGALAMTATDLRAAGLNEVAGVVAGYQPPQFMARPATDPTTSIAAARELIESMGERSESMAGSASASEPAGDGVRGRSPRESW